MQQLNDMLPEVGVLCKDRSSVLEVGQNVCQVVGCFSDNACREDVQSGVHRQQALKQASTSAARLGPPVAAQSWNHTVIQA